jgi:serine/threonine protein kinase
MADERSRGLRLDTNAASSSQKRARPAFRTFGSDDAAYATSFSEFSTDAYANTAPDESAILSPSLESPSPSRNAKNNANQSEISQLEEALRQRGTSISFAPEVKLEDGDVLALDVPLPKKEHSVSEIPDHEVVSKPFDIPVRSRPRSNSESETEHYDVYTGEPLDQRSRHERQQYHRGELRHPLLQTTVDDLARNSPYRYSSDYMPSLTSELTASPVAELRTPLNDRLLSPITSSPMEINGDDSQGTAWSSKRAVSSRSFGSLGSVGRRHAVKSGGSSLSSPARSFLSQLQATETVREPDEDDEGQEIGDHSGYIIGRQIGYGGSSVVKEVKTIQNGKRLVRAVKIVRKHINGKNDPENEQLQADFEREVGVWRYLRHRYILPLLAVYDTPFATFCITKLNTGGTLFDLVRTRRKLKHGLNGLPSNLAKRYIYQLGSAIRYLHEDVHVVHRDIKPENCLLDMSDPNAEKDGGNILLCDFGMADFIHNDNRGPPDSPDLHHDSNLGNIGPGQTSTAVQGSLEYTAPEMVNSRNPLYSTEADIWAYGCVMFTLLTGDRPFFHEFQPRLLMMISKGDWDIDMLASCPASVEDSSVLELVTGCLELQPEHRFNIRQVLETDWLAGCKALYEPDEERFD